MDVERQNSIVGWMHNLMSDQTNSSKRKSGKGMIDESKIPFFIEVLRWCIEESLHSKRPLDPSLLLLSFRECQNEKDKKVFVEALMDVCRDVLTPPVDKLDWIWFNTYVADSAVCECFSFFIGDWVFVIPVCVCLFVCLFVCG